MAENYRSIFILSPISKILEKYVSQVSVLYLSFVGIYWFLESIWFRWPFYTPQ